MNVSKIAENGLLYTQTGTPYYASPEVWADKPYDYKSDVWSVGCICAEMYLGYPLLPSSNSYDHLNRILKLFEKLPDNDDILKGK